jgi:Ca-activated chloride channel family protein
VGLIAFSSEPQVAAPPSTDRDVVRQSLDQLDFLQAYGGTAIGDALAAAVDLGKKTVSGTGPQTIAYTVSKPSPLVSILFLSDGKQTRGSLTPLAGAQRAKTAGIPVYTVALGTPNGVLTRPFGGFGGVAPTRIPVPPDPATLSAIARLTGGKFFNAQSSDAVQSAYKQLGSKLGRVPGSKEVTNEAVLLAALALLAAGVLSALWSPRLP